ncbi:hypothetical protein ACIQCQ_40910 [Streptomyces sp. NPDC088394]|uniref:hypothetical protein n=1 Tax=unclassified Streptomyces TaxID=2593676 RepID=UPI003437F4C4
MLDFLHRAGRPSEDRAIDDPELIEWRGGGPYGWNTTDSSNPHPFPIRHALGDLPEVFMEAPPS